jgi:transcriptional regulator with PAS, ATPase and Fis domain
VSDDPTTRGARLEDLHVLVVCGAELEVVEGPEKGLVVRVEGGGTVVIGTGQSSDMRLSDPLVSRRHLEVHGAASGVRIVDCKSRNGTLYHGARVGELVLTDGADLLLGATRIVVKLDGAPVRLPFTQRTTFGSAVAHSESMRHVFRVLELAAAKDVTVLLEGESGTGKEVLATSIHAESPRRDGPFVVVDCGSIPANLVESELFGHERGAFTGAVAAHQGAFERAHKGTIFLDELGELPLEAQPKLLRALESRTIRRVGGRDAFPIDVRVVAATNRRLKEAVRCREFREDLFYRVSVVHVVVPPLAARREDIGPLAEKFLRQSVGDARLPDPLLRLLTAYDWPGNVRELRNVIERFATFRESDPALLFGRDDGGAPTDKDTFDLASILHLPYAEAKRRLLDAYHRAAIPRVLAEVGGVVPKAAEKLGMSRTNLYRLIDELKADGSDS